CVGPAHRKANCCQSPLVASLASVADYERQSIGSKMIMTRPRDRATNQESAVATSEVENDLGSSTKKLSPVEATILWKRFQGSLRPSGRIKHLAREWDAEFALGLSRPVVSGGMVH